MKKREIKPAELVEAALERIERHNPQLNAVVFKAYDEARAMANTNLSGPFAGVQMLLKDILGFKRAGRTGAAPASCQRYLRLSIQRW